MPDRVIINKDIIELELEKVLNPRGGYHLIIRIIKGADTEPKIYPVEVTDSLLGSSSAEEILSKFNNDFIYWLLRRLFVKRYQEKGMGINDLVGLGTGNYKSLIGISMSKDEALLALLRMIRIFVEDNSERPINLLELFLSSELHLGVLQNAINDASKLYNLIKKRGTNQVELIDGGLDALKDKIDDLENRDSAKPIKIFHEVEITLTPPFGFLLMPFKDKKGFKYSDYKDHIIPHIENHHGIQCHDVRNSELPNFVNNKIYTCIKKSDFVIADITGFNPNVFYELGITHQMGRVNIVVGKDPAKNLPFDIKLFDYDRYSTIDELKKIIDSRLPSIMNRD